MTKIELSNVSKTFASRDRSAGSVHAARALSVTIESGEFFTFVGPSGCGKSTALNLIAGLETASDGEIRFNGSDVTKSAPKERDVAMVFQSYALYPHLSVFKNIAFPLELRGVEKQQREKAVDEIAATLGLRTLLKRKPKELSGGQRQRVALARALIRRPKVFLMDEPLSNLDARLRLEMRSEIRRIFLEEKITTIYVTHDQEEAMVLSDRLAVMRDGSIEQCGTPLETYNDPQSQFVAEFIGSPPVNILPGESAAKLFPKLAARMSSLSSNINAAIRPTKVSVIDPSESEVCDDSAYANLRLLEMTGEACWGHLEFEDQLLRARIPAELSIREGASVRLKCDPADFMFFSSETGARNRAA